MAFRGGRPAFTALLLLPILAAAARGASAVVQCGQVTQLMAPCMPYLAGAPGMTPYGLCCNSIGVLNQMAPAPADRVAICNCVKAAAGGGFPSVDFGRASALPAACGLSISFTIAPNMDCDQVTEELRA
ncbi:non-specific lipid-transfer protein 1-like [Oryza brachyantha]|uniref:non-specific lipid-transfer protein 1-like n=1 Tax=Oryza brachyantha TaxID=4533 RepID=UPI001ADA161F|nr:non-specific lipid-transfer protein 1-like [Oryza brachyantha]